MLCPTTRAKPSFSTSSPPGAGRAKARSQTSRSCSRQWEADGGDTVLLAVANPSNDEHPRANDVSEEEVAAFIDEQNITYPSAHGLRRRATFPLTGSVPSPRRTSSSRTAPSTATCPEPSTRRPSRRFSRPWGSDVSGRMARNPCCTAGPILLPTNSAAKSRDFGRIFGAGSRQAPF